MQKRQIQISVIQMYMQSHTHKILLVACAILLCFMTPVFLSSCSFESEPVQVSESIEAMDTTNRLTIYAQTKQDAQNDINACNRRLQELDSVCTVEGTTSEFARLNQAKGNPVKLSEDEYDLLTRAYELARETQGAFDPSIYPLTHAWGFTSGNHRVPSKKEIQKLKSCVGYKNIHLNNEDTNVTLSNGAQIDMGAICKGYAADDLTALLKDKHVTSAILDLGGNITVIGSKPNGKEWHVGIRNPENPEKNAGVISLVDKTVSTSGAYQRYFDDEHGKRWHHLIDPKTGYSSESDIESISVVSSSGTRCDALSTALFIMGTDKACQFWQDTAKQQSQENKFDFVLIRKDKSVLITEPLADKVKMEDTFNQHTVVVSGK